MVESMTLIRHRHRRSNEPSLGLPCAFPTANVHLHTYSCATPVQWSGASARATTCVLWPCFLHAPRRLPKVIFEAIYWLTSLPACAASLGSVPSCGCIFVSWSSEACCPKISSLTTRSTQAVRSCLSSNIDTSPLPGTYEGYPAVQKRDFLLTMTALVVPGPMLPPCYAAHRTGVQNIE